MPPAAQGGAAPLEIPERGINTWPRGNVGSLSGANRREHMEIAMRIEWSIEKKRGNLRPVLRYAVTLERSEQHLALPMVRVASTIPEPPSSWQAFCYPNQLERAGAPPAGFYLLMTPTHKRGAGGAELRLPWRPDNRYPEVEESFAALRAAFEAELSAAHGSEPLSLRGELELRPRLREAIAPAVIAERLLRLAG